MWAAGRGLGSGLRELVLLGLYVAYTASRTLASGEIEPARHHAAGLLALERSLNIDVELWLNHRVSDVPPIALAAPYWYAVFTTSSRPRCSPGSTGDGVTCVPALGMR
jgi:hypothetical protein